MTSIRICRFLFAFVTSISILSDLVSPVEAEEVQPALFGVLDGYGKIPLFEDAEFVEKGLSEATEEKFRPRFFRSHPSSPAPDKIAIIAVPQSDTQVEWRGVLVEKEKVSGLLGSEVKDSDSEIPVLRLTRDGTVTQGRFSCLQSKKLNVSAPDSSSAPNPLPRTLGVTARLSVGTDADAAWLSRFGGDANASNNYILSILHAANEILEAELGIGLTVTAQHSWSGGTDPFTAASLQSRLSQFQNYWEGRQGPMRWVAIRRLFTGRAGTSTAVGVSLGVSPCRGAASLSVASGDFLADVVNSVHEIGHDLGAGHDTFCNGTNVMCPVLQPSARQFGAQAAQVIADSIPYYPTSCLVAAKGGEAVEAPRGLYVLRNTGTDPNMLVSISPPQRVWDVGYYEIFKSSDRSLCRGDPIEKVFLRTFTDRRVYREGETYSVRSIGLDGSASPCVGPVAP